MELLQLCGANNFLKMILSIIELIIGATFMMLGLFRFTVYRRNFNKPFIIGGITIDADVISVAFFVIGLVLVLLFLVNTLQPLFYKGRDLHPGITYILSISSAVNS
jgi:hypothetical protein